MRIRGRLLDCTTATMFNGFFLAGFSIQFNFIVLLSLNKNLSGLLLLGGRVYIAIYVTPPIDFTACSGGA